jgi:hypothetical protein
MSYLSTSIKTNHVSGTAYKWYSSTIYKEQDVDFLILISDNSEDRVREVTAKTLKALNDE